MGRRNPARWQAALPLTLAAGVATATFAFLALAGMRAPAGSAPAATPPVSVHRPPAGFVTQVSAVHRLPVRVATIPGPSQSLAWGGGWLWAPGIGGLVRISPSSLAVSTSSRFFGTCVDSEVAYGTGGIWSTDGDCGGGGLVFEFDPQTRLRRTIRLPAPAVGVGVWNGRIWVTTMAAQNSQWAVVRIDPRRGSATPVGGRLYAQGDPAAGYGVGPLIPVGGGRFWSPCNDGGVILMTLQPSGRVTGVVERPDSTSTGLAFGSNAIWAGLNLVVERLDPRTGQRDGTVLRPPSSPVAVAYGQGTVWIATSGYEVYGFRPDSTSMVRVARLGFEPATMLYADGYLWATDGQTFARIGPLAAA